MIEFFYVARTQPAGRQCTVGHLTLQMRIHSFRVCVELIPYGCNNSNDLTVVPDRTDLSPEYPTVLEREN